MRLQGAVKSSTRSVTSRLITKRDRPRLRRRINVALAGLATLAGGTLFGTCEMRVRSAVINGSKDFFFTALSDTLLGPLAAGGNSANVSSGGSPFGLVGK